jgi:prepilin-type N-terminal cleavage/methylation domain-containing protein
MKNFVLKNKKGFSLIEVIVACSIISFVVFGFVSISTKSIQISNKSLKQTQAIILLEEGVEAVKSIRDDGWSNISSLSDNINYFLFFNTTSNKWELFTDSNSKSGYIPNYPIDSIFSRTVVFSPIQRDSSTDDISNTGNMYFDENTKSVKISVSFNEQGDQIEKSLDLYISNIFE